MIEALLVGLGIVAIAVLGDKYLALLSRVCPPDPRLRRAPQPPVGLLRQQRLHRDAMSRYWRRHPFDQELE